MKALTSEISIGKYTFSGVVGCKIKKTTRLLGNTAIVELPLSAVFENTTRLNLANEIKRGDKVSINLGYDGDLLNEFNGFVLSLSMTNKTVIECADISYLLTNSQLSNKLFANAELSEIVDYIIAGTGVPLSGDVPEMKIDGFLIKNMTAIKALQKLRNEYGIAVFIDNEDKVFVGLAYTYNSGKIDYDLQLDIPEGGNRLEFKVADDIKLKIKAVSILKNNKRLEREVGDSDGDSRTLYFNGITDEKKLVELANEEIKKYKYDGYSGTLTTFGNVLSKPGMSANIVDANFPAREGTYFIEGLVVSFGNDGFRRTVELGVKL